MGASQTFGTPDPFRFIQDYAKNPTQLTAELLPELIAAINQCRPTYTEGNIRYEYDFVLDATHKLLDTLRLFYLINPQHADGKVNSILGIYEKGMSAIGALPNQTNEGDFREYVDRRIDLYNQLVQAISKQLKYEGKKLLKIDSLFNQGRIESQFRHRLQHDFTMDAEFYLGSDIDPVTFNSVFQEVANRQHREYTSPYTQEKIKAYQDELQCALERNIEYSTGSYHVQTVGKVGQMQISTDTTAKKVTVGDHGDVVHVKIAGVPTRQEAGRLLGLAQLKEYHLIHKAYVFKPEVMKVVTRPGFVGALPEWYEKKTVLVGSFTEDNEQSFLNHCFNICLARCFPWCFSIAQKRDVKKEAKALREKLNELAEEAIQKTNKKHKKSTLNKEALSEATLNQFKRLIRLHFQEGGESGPTDLSEARINECIIIQQTFNPDTLVNESIDIRTVFPYEIVPFWFQRLSLGERILMLQQLENLAIQAEATAAEMRQRYPGLNEEQEAIIARETYYELIDALQKSPSNKGRETPGRAGPRHQTSLFFRKNDDGTLTLTQEDKIPANIFTSGACPAHNKTRFTDADMHYAAKNLLQDWVARLLEHQAWLKATFGEDFEPPENDMLHFICFSLLSPGNFEEGANSLGQYYGNNNYTLVAIVKMALEWLNLQMEAGNIEALLSEVTELERFTPEERQMFTKAVTDLCVNGVNPLGKFERYTGSHLAKNATGPITVIHSLIMRMETFQKGYRAYDLLHPRTEEHQRRASRMSRDIETGDTQSISKDRAISYRESEAEPSLGGEDGNEFLLLLNKISKKLSKMSLMHSYRDISYSKILYLKFKAKRLLELAHEDGREDIIELAQSVDASWQHLYYIYMRENFSIVVGLTKMWHTFHGERYYNSNFVYRFLADMLNVLSMGTYTALKLAQAMMNVFLWWPTQWLLTKAKVMKKDIHSVATNTQQMIAATGALCLRPAERSLWCKSDHDRGQWTRSIIDSLRSFFSLFLHLPDPEDQDEMLKFADIAVTEAVVAQTPSTARSLSAGLDGAIKSLSGVWGQFLKDALIRLNKLRKASNLPIISTKAIKHSAHMGDCKVVPVHVATAVSTEFFNGDFIGDLVEREADRYLSPQAVIKELIDIEGLLRWVALNQPETIGYPIIWKFFKSDAAILDQLTEAQRPTENTLHLLILAEQKVNFEAWAKQASERYQEPLFDLRDFIKVSDLRAEVEKHHHNVDWQYIYKNLPRLLDDQALGKWVNKQSQEAIANISFEQLQTFLLASTDLEGRTRDYDFREYLQVTFHIWRFRLVDDMMEYKMTERMSMALEGDEDEENYEDDFDTFDLDYPDYEALGQDARDLAEAAALESFRLDSRDKARQQRNGETQTANPIQLQRTSSGSSPHGSDKSGGSVEMASLARDDRSNFERKEAEEDHPAPNSTLLTTMPLPRSWMDEQPCVVKKNRTLDAEVLITDSFRLKYHATAIAEGLLHGGWGWLDWMKPAIENSILAFIFSYLIRYAIFRDTFLSASDPDFDSSNVGIAFIWSTEVFALTCLFFAFSGTYFDKLLMSLTKINCENTYTVLPDIQKLKAPDVVQAISQNQRYINVIESLSRTLQKPSKSSCCSKAWPVLVTFLLYCCATAGVYLLIPAITAMAEVPPTKENLLILRSINRAALALCLLMLSVWSLVKYPSAKKNFKEGILRQSVFFETAIDLEEKGDKLRSIKLL